LGELALVPSAYYDGLKVQPYLAVMFAVIHALFTGLICGHLEK